MNLAETLNRTMKLAMDEGKVNSYEEAQALFSSFKLRIKVQSNFSNFPAAEAAVLTLLNSAPRTFLGGVELVGPLDECCTMAWFNKMTLAQVAQQYKVSTISSEDDIATIFVGNFESLESNFCLGISLQLDGFVLSPDMGNLGNSNVPIEAGIASAGAALCEAFQYIYRKAPLAGQRNIQCKLPARVQKINIENFWLIGLGHLGQAFLWTIALAGGHHIPRTIRLTDNDIITYSSLSTCLLTNESDVGKKKVDVVAAKMEFLGIQVERDYMRLNLDLEIIRPEQSLVIVAVDNLALRRSLDRLSVKRVLEAGIGEGSEAFTRIQMHSFPGPRKARDVWCGEDVRSSHIVDLSKPAYQALLSNSKDECGTTLVAGRAVATPFIGAFAGAVLSSLAMDSFCCDYAWNFDVASL